LPDLLNRRNKTQGAAPATLDEDDEVQKTFVSFTGKSPSGYDKTDGIRIMLTDESTIFFHPSGNTSELRCCTQAVMQTKLCTC
jgi:hypothetical protein